MTLYVFYVGHWERAASEQLASEHDVTCSAEPLIAAESRRTSGASGHAAWPAAKRVPATVVTAVTQIGGRASESWEVERRRVAAARMLRLEGAFDVWFRPLPVRERFLLGR